MVLANVRLMYQLCRFPVPARTSHIQTYKPFSSIVQSEYNLALFERVVQVHVYLYCAVVLLKISTVYYNTHLSVTVY